MSIRDIKISSLEQEITRLRHNEHIYKKIIENQELIITKHEEKDEITDSMIADYEKIVVNQESMLEDHEKIHKISQNIIDKMSALPPLDRVGFIPKLMAVLTHKF